MKKNMLFISILLFLVFCSTESLAQSDSLLPYPAKNMIFPDVHAEVQKKTNGYVFRYSVANGQGALQSIYDYMLELKAMVKPTSSPQDWRIWNLDYDTIQVATWFSEDSVADIDAGEVLVGFSLESAGLPKINRCWIRAWETVKGREGQYDPATASIFKTSLQETTLGPADPPSPFIHLDFVDTLLSYTRQSAALGWLGKERDNDCDDDERPDNGVVRNIEQRLQKAKRELTKGDSVQARKELEKLVQKVERIWKRSEAEEKKQRRDRWEKRDKVIMTSEAYALLKYNTEYLIERLPGERKKKK